MSSQISTISRNLLGYLGVYRMDLSPVESTAEDVAREIDESPQDTDDNWELTDHPDGDDLADFWTGVIRDARKDPDWLSNQD